MFADRIPLYRKLEEEFQSNLLVYVTSDRPNMSAQIAADVIDCFIDHLDKIGPCHKISLYLYTRGGDMSFGFHVFPPYLRNSITVIDSSQDLFIKLFGDRHRKSFQMYTCAHYSVCL